MIPSASHTSIEPALSKPDRSELADAFKTIDSLVGRSQAAQVKFAQGTSQYSLLKNRIGALRIALALIEQELMGQAYASQAYAEQYTQDALERAKIPIQSLLHKSEKSQQSLIEGSWQHTMLEESIKALYIASALIDSRSVCTK